jgi:hypothetical protein
MVYQITKIINNSANSVLLTNPKSERDTHLVMKNSSVALYYYPEIQYVREGEPVNYGIVIKKALNIYTKTNNWCFWDNGKDGLLGVSEPDGYLVFLKHKASNLQLTIDAAGVPSFAAV